MGLNKIKATWAAAPRWQKVTLGIIGFLWFVVATSSPKKAQTVTTTPVPVAPAPVAPVKTEAELDLEEKAAEVVRLKDLDAHAEANLAEAKVLVPKLLAEAKAAAESENWEGTINAADGAREKIDAIAGTHVEHDKAYIKLRAAMDSAAKSAWLKKSYVKHFTAKMLDAMRGPKPVNSSWDGSIYEVESYIKARLNDPDSYKHVSTTVPVADMERGGWYVRTSYRSKNGFGALVLGAADVWVTGGKVSTFQSAE